MRLILASIVGANALGAKALSGILCFKKLNCICKRNINFGFSLDKRRYSKICVVFQDDTKPMSPVTDAFEME